MTARPAPAQPAPLCDATLPTLPQNVARPGYDRGALSPGILHIGLGNFHRAHQAVYLDDLFAAGRDHDWAILGAGLMPGDARMRQTLEGQDWLTTVVEMAPGHLEARVIGAMVGFCDTTAPAIAARIAEPDVRIVSMTITEGGYFVDAKGGGFDEGDPDIRRDAANPDAPRTVFGALLAGLEMRRARGLAPPTILSCDNLPENGRVARQAVMGLAGMISQELADWVADEVAFPNSMVDRITPATSDAICSMVEREFHIADAAPVVCEPFRQWVMEDKFPLGRPALEDVGVQFVSDVAAYETMKLRILNAGHASIAYPAALLGIEYVHEAMADDGIAAWLDALMRRDVIPALNPIPGVDYHAYLSTCAERFANSQVRDTIARLCQDGSDRQPKFVLPTIADALKSGGDIEGLALEAAFWCRYCAQEPVLDDPRAKVLAEAARATRADPMAFLRLGDVFGDLAGNSRFADSFGYWIARLWQDAPRAVLRAYLDRAGA